MLKHILLDYAPFQTGTYLPFDMVKPQYTTTTYYTKPITYSLIHLQFYYRTVNGCKLDRHNYYEDGRLAKEIVEPLHNLYKYPNKHQVPI